MYQQAVYTYALDLITALYCKESRDVILLLLGKLVLLQCAQNFQSGGV